MVSNNTSLFRVAFPLLVPLRFTFARLGSPPYQQLTFTLLSTMSLDLLQDSIPPCKCALYSLFPCVGHFFLPQCLISWTYLHTFIILHCSNLNLMLLVPAIGFRSSLLHVLCCWPHWGLADWENISGEVIAMAGSSTPSSIKGMASQREQGILNKNSTWLI